MMGISFLVPVFLQGVLKFTPIQAGLSLLPMALAVIVASPLAGGLSDRFGSKWVVAIGLFVMSVGSFILANFTVDTKISSMILPFVISGFGIGLAMSPITAAALRKVPTSEVGGASGVLSMLRQFGSTLGIAILVTVFSGLMASYGATAVSKIDSSVLPESVKTTIVSGMKSGSSNGMSTQDQDKYLKFFAPAKREKIRTAMSDAMMGSMCESINQTFRIAAAVALLGCVSALFLSGSKKGKKEEKA
jgi:MFS family permease